MSAPFPLVAPDGRQTSAGTPAKASAIRNIVESDERAPVRLGWDPREGHFRGPIGRQRPQLMFSPRWRSTLVTVRCHNQATRAVAAHLVKCPSGWDWVSTTSASRGKRAITLVRAVQCVRMVNNWNSRPLVHNLRVDSLSATILILYDDKSSKNAERSG